MQGQPLAELPTSREVFSEIDRVDRKPLRRFPRPISFAGVLALMIQRFVLTSSIRERAACTFRDHTSQRDVFTAGTRLGR